MKTALVLPLLLAALTGAGDPLPQNASPTLLEAPPLMTAGAPDKFNHWKGKPAEAYGDPEKSFRKAFDVLKEQYVDQGLTEADLWRAATQGMLEHAGERPYDQLLAPGELAEIEGSLGGEIVASGSRSASTTRREWRSCRA
jgi:C-terminal processing protease CtpA/Prc